MQRMITGTNNQYNKNIEIVYILFFEFKFKFSVYFIVRAHLNLDEPRFKCSLATCVKSTTIDKFLAASESLGKLVKLDCWAPLLGLSNNLLLLLV